MPAWETCCARNSTVWVIQTPLMKLIFNLKIPCNPRKFTTNPKGLLCLRKKESRHELSFFVIYRKSQNILLDHLWALTEINHDASWKDSQRFQIGELQFSIHYVSQAHRSCRYYVFSHLTAKAEPQVKWIQPSLTAVPDQHWKWHKSDLKSVCFIWFISFVHVLNKALPSRGQILKKPLILRLFFH